MKWLDVPDGVSWEAVGDLPDRRRAVDPVDLGDGWTAHVEPLDDWR